MMKFLLRDDLKARGHRYSNKHLIHLEAIGLFPRRVRLGGGRDCAWVLTEIEEYEARVMADRDKPRPPGIFRGKRRRKAEDDPHPE
jgi:hypothetical protein